MVVLPPMLTESPAATANEPEEPIAIDDEELPTETAEPDGDKSDDSGEDDSKSDGQRTVSPGQTGTFFGTQALGDRFVYIVNMSSSMKRIVRFGKTRLRVAAEEVVRSINNLTADQKFYVMLFATVTRPMFDHRVPRMIPATARNKRSLAKWLLSVPNSSGTDPRAALRSGLQLRPSAVFLLSDGQFNGQSNERNRAILNGNPSVEQIVQQNRVDDIAIHTIALENNYESRMQSLAHSTGGHIASLTCRPIRIEHFA